MVLVSGNAAAVQQLLELRDAVVELGPLSKVQCEREPDQMRA